jgi:integrase/recombinase XerC
MAALDDAGRAAGAVPLLDAIAVAAEHTALNGRLDALSGDRLVTLWRRFGQYATAGLGVASVREVDANVVDRFLEASTLQKRAPSVATQHLRLTAVRLLFRVLRELRLATTDPTMDVSLPPRKSLPVRALTDDEVELCRWASLNTTAKTRRPTVWALLESGVSTSEIGYVRGVDVDGDRVWVTSALETPARWVELGPWARPQVGRRVQEIGADLSSLLAVENAGPVHVRRNTVTKVIADIFRVAGLKHTDIGPRSVRAWVAHRIFDDTGRIELVAQTLGLNTLDLAARLAGWDWKETQS